MTSRPFPTIRAAAPSGPWTESHTYEEPPVKSRTFLRALFFGCRFKSLRSTTFAHCSLQGSYIEPERLEDILGLTVTMDCFSWVGVHLNELAFDAMLWLLAHTRGNDAKREVLMRLITPSNSRDFEKSFENLERLR